MCRRENMILFVSNNDNVICKFSFSFYVLVEILFSAVSFRANQNNWSIIISEFDKYN